MQPTHINIIGRSKHVFNREVFRQISQGQGKFRDLIQRIEPGGVIALSKRVTNVDDIAPLISYLTRFGIPRADIRVRYPQLSAGELLGAKLSRGLRIAASALVQT